MTLAGKPELQTTETNAQTRIRKAGTLTNMFINETANSGSNVNGYMTSRVGSGAGNLTIATGTTTGIKEDTTHTDTLVAGDDRNYQFATTGNITIVMYVAGVEFTSTNGDSVIITCDSTAATIATSVQYISQ